MVAEFDKKEIELDVPLTARNELIGFRTREEKKLEEEIIKGIQFIDKQKIINFQVNDNDKMIGFEPIAEKKTTELIVKKFLHLDRDVFPADPYYLKFRDDLISLKSKQEIIDNALKIVCNKLKCQVAAIFLYSKNGTLARVGIKGKDKNNKPIENNWLDGESYQVGESFTGRAVSPEHGAKYGGAQIAKNFNQENLKNQDKYLKKLGRFDCGIAVPLNGRNMTYGVLRIINKVDPNDTIFSQKSLDLLSFFGGAIAAAISNFRRDKQNIILRSLKDSLIISERNNFNYSKFYQETFDFLVNSETAFNAAILRVKDENSQTMEIKYFSVAENIKGTEMKEKIRELDTKFISYIGSDHQYFKSHIMRADPRDNISNEFISPEWSEQDKFSCGNFPLIHPHRKEIIGTISLFAGYEYKFHPGIIDFLNNIISTITVILLREKKKKERENKFEQLAKQWFDETGHLSSTTEAVIHPAYQQIIGMGENAIPLLLKELPKRSGRWFWALKAITGDNPVPREHRGKTKLMTQDWIDWGKEKGYISLD